MRSGSAWKNKEKKHLCRKIISACHFYRLLNRNPSRVSASTSPGVSQINKLASVSYQHKSHRMTKIQAQTSASKLLTAGCLAWVERTLCPIYPILIGAAVLSLDLRGWGWREELISATPSEMLLTIYIHTEEKQSLKAPTPQGFYPAGYKSCNRHSLPTFAVQSDSNEF